MMILWKDSRRKGDMNLVVKGTVGAVVFEGCTATFRIRPVSAHAMEKNGKRFAVAEIPAKDDKLIESILIREDVDIAIGDGIPVDVLLQAKKMQAICEFRVLKKDMELSLCGLTME